jgi:hypothetical protein
VQSDNLRPISLRTVVITIAAIAALVRMPASAASAESSAILGVRGLSSGVNYLGAIAAHCEYRGSSEAIRALDSGFAEGVSLASVDLDRDGVPDLVIAYRNGAKGIVVVQRGNSDAYAPKDETLYARMQRGYDPAPLAENAVAYEVPEPPDFLAAGDFDGDGRKDVVVATRGGGLYLLSGDGEGELRPPRRINISGAITAMTAGEFGAADGRADIAVGVTSPSEGAALLIFDGQRPLTSASPMRFQLPAPATALAFSALDDDPFTDIAVSTGNQIVVIHGWGSQTEQKLSSRVELIEAGANVRELAAGFFVWNREGREQLAALADDGTVRILHRGAINTLPFTKEEIVARGRSRTPARTAVDVESVPAWQPAQREVWTVVRHFAASDDSNASRTLARSHLSFLETDDLMLAGGSAPRLDLVRQVGGTQSAAAKMALTAGDLSTTSFDLPSAPLAALILPPKRNGVRNIVFLQQHSSSLKIIALVGPTITVDRTDDAASASACTAAAADCSLRGAITFANANAGTTINLPTGTYVLSINGAGGCLSGGESNAVGDLEINQSTTIVGAGQATTIIRQTGTGNAAHPGDRVMCLNALFLVSLVYDFSALTITGGRDVSTGVGGGGIIGGEISNALTLTNVTISNNQVVSGGNIGGGGLQITGGNLTITNSLIGGSNAPGAASDRTTVANANFEFTSGAGVFYTPSSPMHMGGTGTMTVTGTTFSNNTAASTGSGGGAADVTILAFASPGGIGSGSVSFATSTFSNNQATSASGGAILNEGIPTTVATSSFTSNSAGNQGGAIGVGGGSLALDGTSSGVTMSGNTATNGGSSMYTSAPVNTSGTNVTLGGDVSVRTGGVWTNGAGTSLAPTNIVIVGGTFTCNNSTMNVGGNLSLGPEAVVGGTFNGNTGTVNIAGNFTTTSGGSPATAFNANTGTFNFNGSGPQSISGSLSPTFNNLTVNKSAGTLTLGVNAPVAGNLSVTAGTLDLGVFSANRTAGGGILTVSNGASLKIGGSNTLPSNFTTVTLQPTSTVEYAGTGSQPIAAVNYGHLTSSNSGARTLPSAGTVGIAGTLTPGSNSYTITGSTVDFNGTSSQSIAAFNYNNLTSSNSGSRTLPSSGTVRIGGTFTPGTNSYTIAGSTVEYNGASAQTLPSAFTTYDNLTLNNASGTAGFAGLITQSLLRVQTGTFTSGGTFNNVQIDATTTLMSSASGTINVAGNWTNNGTFSANSGTVNFNGGSAQTLSGSTTTFNNLTINNATGVNLSADTIVNGTATLTAGAFGVGTRLLTLNNTLTATSGTITSGATGTVNYNQGTNAQSVAAANYGNLTFSNFTKTLPNGGTIKIAGTFTSGAAGGHTVTGSTIEFNGTAAQTLPAGFTTYNNLTINNSAGVTLSSDIVVNGTLTLTSGALNVGAHSITINNPIAGTATNLNAGSTSSVIIGGSVAGINLPSNVTTLTNLTLNNSNGTTLQAGLTLSGALTLTNGIIVTGANTLTLTAAGTSSRTNGYVNGNLKKTYGGTGSFTYLVGTANGFSPVATTVTAGTGDLTVKTTQSAQPNVNGSTALHRFWTLTGSGLTANLTFTYVDPADIFGTEANYRIVRVTSGTPSFFTNSCPSAPCVDTAANTATVNGIASFADDWTLAENSDLSVSKSAPGMGVAGDAAGFNYTVTVTNNGPASHAGTVTVVDTLPAGTTFSAAGSDAGCSAIGQVVTCTSSNTIANAGTLSFIIHVTIPSAVPNGTTLSNSATLSSSGTDDGNASNNTSNVTATTVFGAPVGLVATATAMASQVDLIWSAVAGANHYDIYRSSNNSAYASAGTSGVASFTDLAVTGGITYLYIVRAVNGSGTPSPFSKLDPATTINFADDPLIAGTTTILAQHLTQLRTAIDAFRASTGMGGGTYTNGSPLGVTVQAIHLQQLRTALDPALAALGLLAVNYTDPTIVSGTTAVKARHFQEIRDAVK